ncbi:molybdopterin converting factor subunit 1 [Thalassotalea euphylliae]|uniref:Molybdopterin synthase sulfur carrier subunit n=1 Tax=Thalassotalea euphylliae TaxID=1655234 RepID=A0A3E0UDA1_9GAMM|nr:molybdopterin converting factor subunit 1 [Thalassotalea euphylliae]REL34557.1 molybdopterin converting factor subunit 1 [Thalassotalea euphylliae]
MLTVLFFARLREQLGQASVRIAVNENTTVEQVLTQLKEEYPDWQSPLSSNNILAALNQQMVSKDTVVNAGDELAFFPPVTGG